MSCIYTVTYPHYEPVGVNSKTDLLVIELCNKITLKTLGTMSEGAEISPKRGNFKIIYKTAEIDCFKIK